ncbi:hypothetical protein WQ54_04025 [Bacillus sp. SA1-12]|uniref:DUF4153 domain-containing protein n=1 Tax=Bacillus sp. SA1-12 TaxID=1455638 RepID=UPI000626018A|nr:DUF4173 domain-containing protein [Bacillus sp. SA1-12]KKI93413.1 hypothetical protein WQ54_04025 [Bacillus sp. SA1-12]
MEKTWRNFMICLAGGILFHHLFYGKELGVSYPIYAMFLYLVFYARVAIKGKKQEWFHFVLGGSALLLAVSFGIFSNEPLLVLNFLIVPLLMFIHMVHTRRWDLEKWSNRLFIKLMFITFFETIIDFFNVIFSAGKTGKGVMHDQKGQMVKKIILGVLLSAPLLWTILYLLISSDQYFKQLLGKFPDWLYQANIGSMFFQVILVAVITCLLFAFFMTLAKPLVLNSGEGESRSMKLDTVIVSTMLILLNIVYFLYAAVQFTYFFTGDPSSSASAYTYAEYARRGFMELTLVSIINIGLLFLLTHIGKFEKRVLPNIIKLLLSLLVFFTFVMLASAYNRLSLYEQAYGYTYLRLYAHAFMVLLCILLGLALIKIYIQRFKLLKAMCIATIVAYVIVNYINIDRFIVSQNMKRYEETGKLDLYYLDRLSYDAIPIMIEQKNEMFNKLLKEKKMQLIQEETTWQTFNVSKSHAKQLLKEWTSNNE